MSTTSDISRLGTAFSTLRRDFYAHSTSFVLISVCWFLASLPLVTLPPATLGAYAAIESVLETGSIDRQRVRHAVRTQFLPSIVIGIFPPMFLVGSLFFMLEFFETVDPTTALLTIGSVYAFVFSVLVLIPAFVWMARGEWAGTAIKKGYLWVINHPTLAVTTGLVTLVIFVVTLALTIGFVLLFAGLAFTLHVALLPSESEDGRTD